MRLDEELTRGEYDMLVRRLRQFRAAAARPKPTLTDAQKAIGDAVRAMTPEQRLAVRVDGMKAAAEAILARPEIAAVKDSALAALDNARRLPVVEVEIER
jgi:hypothetical protein